MGAADLFPISVTRRHIVNSVPPARRKDLDDLKKPGSGRQECDSLDLQHLAETSIPLVVRIDWCRRQRGQARTQREVEGWCAEEEGLRDALSKRDGTYQHRDSPPMVFERYAMGLEDGRALIRLGRVDCLWHPSANGTHV